MAAAKSNTNWFAIGVSAAVVIVLVALGGFVWFLNSKATAPGAAPESAIVDSKTGAISFGEGKTTVDTYIDFMCPNCGAFEQQFGKDLQQAAADDKITLRIHPVSILDRMSQGTEYSSRAASAMYCVANASPESGLPFMNLLFENQPQEGSAGLTDEQLTEYAKQAGAEKAADCIAEGTYAKFSRDQVETMIPDSEGRVGTPTVLIDDKRVDLNQVQTEFAKILG